MVYALREALAIVLGGLEARILDITNHLLLREGLEKLGLYCIPTDAVLSIVSVQGLMRQQFAVDYWSF